MRSCGMSRLERGGMAGGRGRGLSCPPIIILTGFNLNNAACGFHRHARARLIISRTNSPTRYPSMVYTTPPRRPPLYFFPSSSVFPVASPSPPPSPVTKDLRFGFLRASLALSPASSRQSRSLRLLNLLRRLYLCFGFALLSRWHSHFRYSYSKGIVSYSASMKPLKNCTILYALLNFRYLTITDAGYDSTNESCKNFTVPQNISQNM